MRIRTFIRINANALCVLDSVRKRVFGPLCDGIGAIRVVSVVSLCACVGYCEFLGEYGRTGRPQFVGKWSMIVCRCQSMQRASRVPC